jgi:hypothetical protein
MECEGAKPVFRAFFMANCHNHSARVVFLPHFALKG